MKDFLKKYKQNIIYGLAGVGIVALLLVVFSVSNVWRGGRGTVSTGTFYDESYGIGGAYEGKAMAPAAFSMDATAPVKEPVPEIPSDRKIIKNGYLSLLVEKAETAVDEIKGLADSVGGFVERSELYDSGGIILRGPGQQRTNKQGTIVVRVPAQSFDEVVSSIKALAIKVENESNNIRDVSAEYIDLDAQLKNLRAEEGQYLDIMKRAVKIEDVLNVSGRLSDVRGKIERLQAQINHLSKQVDLSTITVNLRSEADIESVGASWRPISVAKQAIQDMLSSLTNYVDGAIVFIINIPVLLLKILTWLLWILAWALGLYIVWRVFKFVKGRY